MSDEDYSVDAYYQLSLFSDDSTNEVVVLNETHFDKSSLVTTSCNEFRHENIFQYIKPVISFLKSSGTGSVVEICDYLVREHGADDRMFITGKFQIYPEVCLFMDRLVLTGEYKLISEEPNKSNRIYKRVEQQQSKENEI